MTTEYDLKSGLRSELGFVIVKDYVMFRGRFDERANGSAVNT